MNDKDPYCTICEVFINMGDLKHSGHLIVYCNPNELPIVENNDLIEKVADFMHDQWSHWMKYLFNIGDWQTEYSQFVFDDEYYLRWQRQMNTPYSELSEKEKDSDREWAIKLLELIKNDRF